MGEFSVSSDICTFLNRKHALHHDIHCKWQHNQQHVGCYQQQSSPETFSSGLQVVAPPRFHGCLIVSVSNERLYPKVLQCEAHYRSRYDLTLYTHCQIHVTHVWCTIGFQLDQSSSVIICIDEETIIWITSTTNTETDLLRVRHTSVTSESHLTYVWMQVRSYSGPSPGTTLPLETLAGANAQDTTVLSKGLAVCCLTTLKKSSTAREKRSVSSPLIYHRLSVVKLWSSD